MTSGFVFLLIMLLLRGSGRTPSLSELATHAQVDAMKKRDWAVKTGKATDIKRASDAQAHATRLANVSKQADASPAPWPQKLPAGLPPFPAGWEFDEPPPQAVQTRAAQLLTTLWKAGAGKTKTEKTAGRWITYQSQKMGTKKGVVAYRIKAALLPGGETTPSSLAV